MGQTYQRSDVSMILHKRWLKWVLGLSVFALSTGMLAFFRGNYVATGGPDESSESEEVSVASGTLDDGAHLIDQAAISLEAALLAAQGAADGSGGRSRPGDVPGRAGIQRGHWQCRCKGCCLQWSHSRPRIRNRRSLRIAPGPFAGDTHNRKSSDQ